MGLRFDPMGGGQFKAAQQAIIEAESQPIKQLEARKAREEAKMKLFQEFKGKFTGVDKALQEVASLQKLRELKVDLGDGTNQVAITLDKDKAQTGSYQIEVSDLAARTSVISNGFSNPDEAVVGMGFVVLNTSEGSKEIYVEEGASSLKGIAHAINNEKDSPVRASVIQDATDPEAPWRLIITSKKDGAVNQVDIPEFYFMDGTEDFYLDDKHESKNALVKIDGFELELGSNDVQDFLPGVNVHLKQAKDGSPFTLTITEDYQKINAKMKGLVDQLNGILSFINKQNQIDEKSDTKTTFAGDSSLQSIEFRLRNIMHEGFPVGDPESDDFRVVRLNEVGVEFDKTGTIQFKEDKFQKFMEKDFEGLSQAITGEYGFAAQMREIMAGYTKIGGGMLGVREAGIRDRIKELDRQIETKQRNLEKKTQALTDQFSRLQGTLSGMQRQQQYLSATMGGGGGGNILQQLMGG